VSDCACNAPHEQRRIVLTGGPGAGKTAVLEVLRRGTCRHVLVLPEAAGILFGGGFPRGPSAPLRRSAQRAIYHVQRELESTAAGDDFAVVLCDRGTVDGMAYWPGPDDMWSALGTSLDAELARYHAVIHLRTPSHEEGYSWSNPLRIESAAEAAAIDVKIAAAWALHPRRIEVPAMSDFLAKTARAVAAIQALIPACCRSMA